LLKISGVFTERSAALIAFYKHLSSMSQYADGTPAIDSFARTVDECRCEEACLKVCKEQHEAAKPAEVERAQKALEPLCAVVFSVVDGEVQVVIQVSPALVAKIKAGDLVKQLTSLLGGGGGGRPEAAQGKGKDAAKLPDARAAAIAAMQAAGLRA
jgi:alanyl-tRNA synthetase